MIAAPAGKPSAPSTGAQMVREDQGRCRSRWRAPTCYRLRSSAQRFRSLRATGSRLDRHRGRIATGAGPAFAVEEIPACNSQGKGLKMDEIYQYLTSPRFGERIQRMVETWKSRWTGRAVYEASMERTTQATTKMQDSTIEQFSAIAGDSPSPRSGTGSTATGRYC